MADTNAAERRRAKRIPASKAIALVVESGIEQIANHAFAIDLSELGARVRTGVHLQPGQRVTVIPREGSGHAVQSRVVWVGIAPGGDSEAGLAFLEPQQLTSAIFSGVV